MNLTVESKNTKLLVTEQDLEVIKTRIGSSTSALNVRTSKAN